MARRNFQMEYRGCGGHWMENTLDAEPGGVPRDGRGRVLPGISAPGIDHHGPGRLAGREKTGRKGLMREREGARRAADKLAETTQRTISGPLSYA